jgi:hypothetical protein
MNTLCSASIYILDLRVQLTECNSREDGEALRGIALIADTLRNHERGRARRRQAVDVAVDDCRRRVQRLGADVAKGGLDH